MKLMPAAPCLTRTWPWAGGGMSTSSNFRTSAPPALGTRTAATMVSLPLGRTVDAGELHRGGIIGFGDKEARRRGDGQLTPTRNAHIGAGGIGRCIGQQEQHRLGDLLRGTGALHGNTGRDPLDAARRMDVDRKS